MTRRIELCHDVLAFGATDHELLFVLCFVMQVVSVDITAVLFSGERLCLLPCKQVERALLRVNGRVKTAEVHPVEVTIQVDWRNAFFGVLGRLGGKFSGDDKTWRAEITIFVNFDRVNVFAVSLRNKAKAVLFVMVESDALNTVPGSLKPIERLDGLAGLGADNE